MSHVLCIRLSDGRKFAPVFDSAHDAKAAAAAVMERWPDAETGVTFSAASVQLSKFLAALLRVR